MEHSVYLPREDSFLLEKYTSEYAKKDSLVLDMGTGSGIQGIAAAKKGAKVVSVDINPKAIGYAREEAKKENLKNIAFVESDLFKKIKKMRFDLIIFNPPYLPEEEGIENIALFSRKQGTQTTVDFIKGANDYLAPDGTILLIKSSLAKTFHIDEEIKQCLLVTKTLETCHIFFEDISVIEIKKSDILKKLEDIGMTSSRLFAEGKRGRIITGIFKKKKIVVKIKKDSSMALETINNEVRILEKLNKYSIGPRLIMHEADFLMYEFVDGIFIEEYLLKNPKRKVIQFLTSVFNQLYKLDTLGINKFEMHHPVKHILVEKDTPVLIDFERARNTIDPKNVTQFCDYLSSERLIKILKSKKIEAASDKLISAARTYKHSPTKVNYNAILEMIR
jgi:release factor glutamine methyltransferase